MRRAMRHAQLLGAADPLMWRLVPAAGARDGPGLSGAAARRIVDFRDAQAGGKPLPQDARPRPRPAHEATETLAEGDRLDGETAFKLYDTFGFPLDLTQDALRQRGIGVDLDGFGAAMQRQKAEARAAWSGSGEAATEAVWFALRERLGATDFLGYSTEQAEGVITALVRDGAEVAEAAEGDDVALIVNQTPFYGESGGQVGDTGIIRGEGFEIAVSETQKKADGLFVHLGKVVRGKLATGAVVEMEVNHARRARIRANHSATHLVHEALPRECSAPMSPRRARSSRPTGCVSIFRIPNPSPRASYRQWRTSPTRSFCRTSRSPRASWPSMMPLPRAPWRCSAKNTATRSASCAWAPPLKVTRPANPIRSNCAAVRMSRPPGDIGLVRLVAEGAVAAGVRRIEALTGEAARRHLDEQDRRLKAAASALKVAPAEVLGRLEAVLDERRKLEPRNWRKARKKLALGGGGAAGAQETETVNGIGFPRPRRGRRLAERSEAAGG